MSKEQNEINIINIDELRKGKLIDINGSIYGMCSDCHSMIKVNKFLFGSLHICKKEAT